MSDTLSKEEAAYFESGGETAPTPETQTTAPATTEREPPETETTETEPGGEGEGQQQRSKTVPHAAFHAERERRKALEAEHERFKGTIQARFEALQAMLQQVAPPAPAAPALPEFESDPRGHIEARMRQQEEALKQQAAVLQQQQEAQQRQVAMSQLAAWGRDSEASFSRTTPDYDKATAHLRNARTEQLRALGVPEAQIPAAIQQDVLQIALATRQAGGNFAERLYSVAKAMGYTPVQAAAAADEARIDTIERGQKLAATVGASGGAAPQRVRAENVAAMSDREFEAFMRKSPDELRRLMGG